jgi:pimeloyl-ACP methyl ester carboxylesterase
MDTATLAEREVRIPIGADALDGDLVRPPGSTGLVLFAHGSGSTRRSVRNRQVAARLHEVHVGTLLFDLLTPAEQSVDDRTRQHRFDIPLLAGRLRKATEWVLAELPEPPQAIGYFGASTGAAAALVAASKLRGQVAAVVSRGGRPDLAGPQALRAVTASTLLIVGERDPEVLQLNTQANEQMRCHRSMVMIPRASHLFEEPGTLELAADHAAAWFEHHLALADEQQP